MKRYSINQLLKYCKTLEFLKVYSIYYRIFEYLSLNYNNSNVNETNSFKTIKKVFVSNMNKNKSFLNKTKKDYLFNTEFKKYCKDLDLELKQIENFYNSFYKELDNNSNSNDLEKFTNELDLVKSLLENKYIQFTNLFKTLDLLYFSNNNDITINKDIKDINSNDLISFRINFNNYYDNKFLFFYALKLFKVYNFDENYYYIVMLKSDLIENFYKFSFYYKDLRTYYDNNKKSYYSLKSVKKYNIKECKETNCYYTHTKKVRKEYKSYNTKKYDIYSSIELLKVSNLINENFIYFLDLDINKVLFYLDNDLKSILDNKDKYNRINETLKELENYFIYLDSLYLSNTKNNYYYQIRKELDNIINKLELELKDLDSFKEYSIYNEYDLSENNTLKSAKTKNNTNVLDNNYNINNTLEFNKNEPFNTLELVFKLKN